MPADWFNDLTNFGRHLARGLADLLYPATCLVCAAPLPADLDHFCESCDQFFCSDPAPQCPRCAATVGPFVHLAAGCPWCKDERFPFDHVIRFGPYEGPLREAVLKMKTHHGEGLAECLGEKWAERMEAILQATKIEVIVPVPLHWRRRLGRGYNQADSLARALATRLRRPCQPSWLRRIRSTPRQASLGPAERKANLQGAFLASSGRALRGKSILLIDDVLTTGSTAAEASRALLGAGASRVVVAVLARAQGQGISKNR